MPDMLANGAGWITEQLQQNVSTPAIYRRDTSAVAIDFTRGRSEYQAFDDMGNLVTEVTDATFICGRDKLILNGTIVNPEAGDRIEIKDGRRTLTYEVRPHGNLGAFKNDAHSQMVWIHTILVIEQ